MNWNIYRTSACIFFMTMLLSLKSFAAGHPSGAEIYYMYQGSGIYTVYIVHFSDCNGVGSTAPTLKVSDGMANGTYYTTLQSTVYYDDNIASGVCTRCSDLNCYIPYGMKMQTYSCDVDMGTFSGCNITFSFSECCLSSAITTGAAGYDYLVRTTLNRCNGDQSSPVFQQNPVFWLNTKQNVRRFQSVAPGNRNDSIVYKMVPVVEPNGKPVPYSTGYAYNHPFAYSGSSESDPLPDGFHYDSTSGALSFKPVKDDVSLVGFEADEYAKDKKGNYYLAGNTIRIYLAASFLQSIGNSNPVLKGFNGTDEDTVYTCSGIPLEFQIKCYDPDVKDSIFLSDVNETGGTISYTVAKYPVASYKWIPANKDVSAKPYHLIMTAKDSYRPFSALVQREYFIYIKDSFPAIKLTKSIGSCSKYTYKALGDTGRIITYQWYADSIPAGSASSLTYTFPFNGKHVIDLRLTNNDGCTNDLTDTLVITGLPDVKITGTRKACQNSVIKLEASGAIKYKWFAADHFAGDTGSTATALPAHTTVYTVQGTDSKGCMAIDTQKVIADSFTIKALLDTIYCKGAYAYIKAETFKAKAYEWKDMAGNILSDSASLFRQVNSDVPYSLTVTDSFGCVKTVNGILRMDKIKANAGKDTSICYGNSAVLHGSGGQYYKWRATNGLSSGSSQPNPVVSPTQTINYNLRVTDTLGCYADDTVRVNVSNIKPVILQPATICQGDSVLLSAYGGNHYKWSPSAGISNPLAANIFAKPLQTTTYTVFICDSLCSCSRTDSVTIIVKSLHLMHPGNDTTICQGKTITMGTAPEKNYKYNWYNKQGTLQGNTVPFAATPAELSYFYIFTKNTLNNCAGIDSVKVDVLTGIHASIKGPDTICPQDTALFAAGISDTRQTYTWISNKARVIYTGHDFTDLAWNASGLQTVTLVQSLNGQCSDTAVKQIYVAPLPMAKIVALADGCVGKTIGFTISGIQNTFYNWNFGDGHTSALQDPQHIYTAPGLYHVLLNVRDKYCPARDSLLVTVHPLPPVNMEVIHSGFRMYGFENKDSAGISGTWETGDGNLFHEHHISHTYRDTGIYHASYTYFDKWGCGGVFDTIIQITDILPVVYKDTVWASPNPFNDQLQLHFTLSAEAPVQVWIYDALGRRVAQKTETQAARGDHIYTFDFEGSKSQGVFVLRFTSGTTNKTFTLVKSR